MIALEKRTSRDYLGHATILSRNSGRYSHQFGYTSDTHFAEHSGTMHLDCFLVDAKIPAQKRLLRSAGVSHQPTEGRFAAALGYEEFTMAEINKLSVGQAIDKLRGKDAPKSEMEQLDQKIEELDEETQRLRSERHRIERDQRANQNKASLSRRVDEPDGPRGFFQNKAGRLIFFGAGVAVLLVLVLSMVW